VYIVTTTGTTRFIATAENEKVILSQASHDDDDHHHHARQTNEYYTREAYALTKYLFDLAPFLEGGGGICDLSVIPWDIYTGPSCAK
jgi:hypothetical protein